jgi:mRNA interferase HicA
MKGSEFLRKLRALAHQRSVAIRLNAERGKGSHQTLYYGDKFTVLRNVKDELKTGTFRAMCKQLGVDPKDL